MTVANTILIADDHALLRHGVRALLAAEPDLEVVAECGTGKDAIRLAHSLRPKLVLMDLSMPGINGIDAIAEIKRRHPDIRILVATLHKADEYIQGAFRAGASGYLSKESTHADLVTAIRTVLNGRIYLSPAVSDRIVSCFSAGTRDVSAWELLTVREREVLKLVAEGHTNRDVAAYLSLSIKTVEKHRASLMHKLGLRNASRLTAYAIEKGIVACDLPGR